MGYFEIGEEWKDIIWYGEEKEDWREEENEGAL